MRALPLLLLVSVLTFTRTVGQSPVNPQFAALLQTKLDSCRATFDVPGISATLLLPGDLYWNGTSGEADINSLELLDTFHVFQGASTTKLFTATIVFQLIEEGLLDLDDTIGTFLAPITNIPGSRRLRYLLNHRSGLAEYLGVDGCTENWFQTPDAVWTPEEVISTYNAPPNFAQNAAFSYSNTNYVLLGMIIEAVTGYAFADELQARILEPLGLEETYFPPALPITGVLTPGWTSFTQTGVYDTDATPVLQDCFASFAFSAGALVTRPWDLAHFTRAAMRGDLLSPESLTTMRTCSNVNFSDGANGYGHGTMRYTYAGRTYFGHSGDISGFTQMAMHGLQDSVTLVLSINRNNAPRGPIAGVLLAAVHEGLTVGMAAAPAPSPSFDLYPVPAREHLTVRSNGLLAGDRIDVLDATGQLVRSEQCTHAGAHQFSVLGLASGAYRVRWSGAGGVMQRALIVQ